MAAEHFLPLFVGDFFASTATMAGPEASLYMMLLAHEWALGPLPADTRKLALLCRYSVRTFNVLWKVVQPKFVEVEGMLINERLEAVRQKSAEIQERRSKAGTAAVNARWDANRIRNVSASNTPRIPSDPIRSDPNLKSSSTLIGERGKNGAARRRAPPDFVVTEALKTWAQEKHPGVDLQRETEAFLDYEFKTGKTDWPATWRSWIRKAKPSLRSATAPPAWLSERSPFDDVE